jgi:hypothetical protein
MSNLPQLRRHGNPQVEAGTVTFNTAVFCPPFVLAQLPKSPVELHWTRHAITELDDTRLDFAHDFDDGFDPESVELAHPDITIVEVSCRGKNVVPVKAVIRVRTRTDIDLVMVITPPRSFRGPWLVVTCWGNDRTDTHTTLRVQRLVPAPVRL